jgi:two-component system, NarL family, sensor kinase
LISNSDIALTVIVSTLTILLFVGLMVLLLVINHNRRNKHRAQLAEMRVRHAEEVRTAEREVLRQTLDEVGRELHDNIGQLLTVARMGINEVMKQSDATSRASKVKDSLDATIGEVRRLSRTLSTDRMNEFTLRQVLEEECQRVQKTTAVQVAFRTEGEEPLVGVDQKVVLFRIFQESLNNALKHGQASLITVTLRDGSGAHLSISDNGAGFDVVAARGRGQGLSNLILRARSIGYHCHITSQMRSANGTGGTTVSLSPDVALA